MFSHTALGTVKMTCLSMHFFFKEETNEIVNVSIKRKVDCFNNIQNIT